MLQVLQRGRKDVRLLWLCLSSWLTVRDRGKRGRDFWFPPVSGLQGNFFWRSSAHCSFPVVFCGCGLVWVGLHLFQILSAWAWALTNTLAEQQTEQTRKTIQPFYFVVSGIKFFLNLVGRSWKSLTSLLTDCQWLTRHLRVSGYIGLANVHAADCPFRSLLFQPEWKGPHCPVTAGIAPNTRTCLLALFWPRLQTFDLDSQLQQFADPASCTVNGNYWTTWELYTWQYCLFWTAHDRNRKYKFSEADRLFRHW